MRHLAMLGAALVAVATLAGCGIKGPLKRADAPPSASTAVPPTTAPDPTLPAR
ncbi:MAG TPA: lipoprotein [Casimicrobiaceae bacterium]|nr:lipoprotein [Casimicrobiaceae bacterium]